MQHVPPLKSKNISFQSRQMGSSKKSDKQHEAICPDKLNKAELLSARDKLAAGEPEYWRNLQELAGDPSFCDSCIGSSRKERRNGSLRFRAALS